MVIASVVTSGYWLHVYNVWRIKWNRIIKGGILLRLYRVIVPYMKNWDNNSSKISKIITKNQKKYIHLLSPSSLMSLVCYVLAKSSLGIWYDKLPNYLLWEWAQCTCCEHGKIWKSKDDRVSKIWCDLYRII